MAAFSGIENSGFEDRQIVPGEYARFHLPEPKTNIALRLNAQGVSHAMSLLRE
jgi:hypothetical protein